MIIKYVYNKVLHIVNNIAQHVNNRKTLKIAD